MYFFCYRGLLLAEAWSFINYFNFPAIGGTFSLFPMATPLFNFIVVLFGGLKPPSHDDAPPLVKLNFKVYISALLTLKLHQY